MGDKVLITGSSGLIGSATARRLAVTYDVIGLDSKPPKQLAPVREHVPVDLTRNDSVEAALRTVRANHGDRIASVVHLAAYYDFSGAPSPLYEEVTVRGTGRLLDELRSFEVEQFVFSSSMLVHAPCAKKGRIDEDSLLSPRWDYPKSKVDTERLILGRRGSIPVAILRIAGVYDDLCHSIPIANQIQRIFERRLTGRLFPGDTSRGQAFVHMEDVVEALALLVERRRALPPELTLLIGEDETLGYGEIQTSLGRLIHDEDWRTYGIPKPLAKAGAWLQEKVSSGEAPFIRPWMIDLADDHYALDISRARRVLGWQPRRSLRATLPKIVEALRADPLGWYRENKLDASWVEKEIARGAEARPQPT